MSAVAAIVLAAGRGTRFGAEPKMLAHLDGRPLVRHVVEAALASGVSQVIVVTGHRADEVEAVLTFCGTAVIPGLARPAKRAGENPEPTGRTTALPLPDLGPSVGSGFSLREPRNDGEEWATSADRALRVLRNPGYADGLSTSLRAGVRALPPGTSAAVVLLGDMPQVSAALIDRLASAWRAAGCPVALVPTYRGQRGNPVVLSAALALEIEALTGDAGAGPLLRGRPDIVEHETDDPAVTLDIDTPAALAGQARTTPSSTAT